MHIKAAIASRFRGGGSILPPFSHLHDNHVIPSIDRFVGSTSGERTLQASGAPSPKAPVAVRDTGPYSLTPHHGLCSLSHQALSAVAAAADTAEQQIEISTAIPHGDASVTGTSVVLDHAARPNKAAVTRNIVFITSEVNDPALPQHSLSTPPPLRHRQAVLLPPMSRRYNPAAAPPHTTGCPMVQDRRSG